MITYEQDPEVLRWGLQLFDGNPYSNCGCCGSVTHNNGECYGNHYLNEDHCTTDFSNTSTKDNELVAPSLQEQFSQFSIADSPQTVLEGAEHAQSSFYHQDWFSQPMGYYTFGNENDDDEEIELGTSNACPTPTGDSYCGEWSYSLELIDEYGLDGEVGKRLTQMVPIPHIPRINGEVPSMDEATLDHQRLLQRLQVYELVELKVQGDGNCQFRALSDQFYRTPEHHEFVRQQIVDQLMSNPEMYEGYVPMAYDDYLVKICKNGEWGDHVTLQAAADSYGVKILVITSFKDTCYIEILPNIQKSERVIFLSFWAEVHYNSIYPEGDMPSSETKKKKRRSIPLDDQFESLDDCN